VTERESYVYAYFRLDGETPCYIGKGKGGRWLHLSKAGGRNLHFVRLVAQAKSLGTPLLRIKVAECLTDREALQLEADLIRLVGREANGGPLVNLTDGGDGSCGYRYTEEQRAAHGARRRGRPLTPEWREAIRAGMTDNPKVIANASKAGRAGRGTKKSNGWWSTPEGRASHMTTEAKKKIAQTLRARAARNAVNISATWANMNSVRYPQLAAA
jgi:hypothetical protein